MSSHGTRKHSKFSASGAARWFTCPGSVALSEGVPSKDSIYSLEGTLAHEVLESIFQKGSGNYPEKATPEMIAYAEETASFIIKIHDQANSACDFLVEEKVHLDFIHPQAFGTLDYSIVEHFGTLHILDFKYGMSLVSPVENLQFIFYALGVAHRYDWNFARIRMWTLQPRARSGGYTFWEITTDELRKYISKFKDAVARVEKFPEQYVEGSHCHWCSGKVKCPLKQEGKIEKAKSVFLAHPINGRNGKTHG